MEEERGSRRRAAAPKAKAPVAKRPDSDRVKKPSVFSKPVQLHPLLAEFLGANQTMSTAFCALASCVANCLVILLTSYSVLVTLLSCMLNQAAMS